MDLTPAQRVALKAAILADPTLSAFPNTSDGNAAVAAALNVTAAPAFVVWKTAVSWDEIMLNGMDWSRVDNLTSGGKFRIWEWMFKNSANAMNPSKANIRAGINATWVGTAADLDVRTAVYVHCKRNATRAEKLFVAVGGGAGTTADPATMTFEGAMSPQEVESARNLP